MGIKASIRVITWLEIEFSKNMDSEIITWKYFTVTNFMGTVIGNYSL